MLKLAKFYILNMSSLLCANHISGYTKQTRLLPGVEPEFRRLLVWGKQLSSNFLFFKALSLLLKVQSCHYSDKRKSSQTRAITHHRIRHKQGP